MSFTNETNDQRQADHLIGPAFLERWSSRSFQNQAIPESKLWSILEAARWAPSANNLQPWRFIVAETKEERDRFYTFINDGNLLWCKEAPVLIALASTTINSQGKPIRTHAFDSGAAWGYLALEAHRQGLVAHAMGGFDRQAAKESLQLPDKYEIHAIVALGYRGDRSKLTTELQAREVPSVREPIEKKVFFGTYGQD